MTAIYNVPDKVRHIAYLRPLLTPNHSTPSLIIRDINLCFDRRDKKGRNWDERLCAETNQLFQAA